MTQRILIIEDEPNIVDALTFLLLREGYAVETESDGANAADRINNLRPDLIILDAMLPSRSGFDLLRDLRAAQNPVPVLMLTAKGQLKDRRAAEEAGASKFMVKPFSNDEIIASVGALLAA